MLIYFAGGETPDHRKRLIEAGVHGISISYWNLRKRYKTERWKVADNFPEEVDVLLDAGALSASKTEDWTEDDWRSYGEEYLDFVENNTSRLTLITEFDSPVLGREYVEQMREEFWEDVSPHRFLPVWHESHGGLAELANMATEFDHVAIPNMAIDDRRVLANRLNSLITQHGVKMHGLGITKPDVMKSVRFASVSSTSWVSPMRYGDTIVWDVNRLRRYPTTMKEQARRRHRALFERQGFDVEKIVDGDPNEVTRLSIWSWLQFEESMNRRKGLRAVGEGEEEVEDDEVADVWSQAPQVVSPATKTSQQHTKSNTARLRQHTTGVTPEQYETLLTAQDGRCAMCGTPAAERAGLSVDHDHVTGEIRGLLCGPCNTALGNLRDQPDLAVAASAYLLDPPARLVADNWGERPEAVSAETEGAPPDNCPPEERKNLPVVPEEMQVLPVLGFERVKKVNDQGEETGSMLIARSSEVSQRKCDTCFVAANCPLMEPGSACKFGFPIELATKDQLVAAMGSVIETQMARVAFARYAEELEGGYPDPNVSSEIDRFFKIIEKMRDITDDRLSLKIEAEARGSAGILSAIFGHKPEENIDSNKAEQVLNDAMGDVLDADVID